MQLKLERRAIQSFDYLYGANTLKDETAEIIVPDSFPDILRIIDVRGLVCLKEKRCTDSGVELIGAVHISVLYAPDISDGSEASYVPVRLGMVIPYQHLFEHRGLSTDTRIVAELSLTDTTARTINPRKVQVSASVFLDVKCYGSMQLELCDKVSAEQGACLETLKKVFKLQMPVSIRDKSFSLTDQIELPSGRPLIGDILHSGVRLVTRETKVIGNKVVFKGGAILSVLYAASGGDGPAMSTWEQEIPFSQIIEMDALDENATISMNMLLMGMELGVEAPARTIDVELNIEAQLQAVSHSRHEILADVYSTGYHVLPEMREYTLLGMSDHFSVKAQVRDTQQIQPPIHSVVDTEINMSQVEYHNDEGSSKMSSQATVRLLYLTDDNEYETASFTLPVEAAVETIDGSECIASASQTGDVFAGASADGVEVRFSVMFEGMFKSRHKLSVVEEIKGDWEAPKELDTSAASVVLRRVGGGESLWDIAKSYNTTQRDILAANALPPGDTADLDAGMLLLIPRKR